MPSLPRGVRRDAVHVQPTSSRVARDHPFRCQRNDHSAGRLRQRHALLAIEGQTIAAVSGQAIDIFAYTAR